MQNVKTLAIALLIILLIPFIIISAAAWLLIAFCHSLVDEEEVKPLLREKREPGLCLDSGEFIPAADLNDTARHPSVLRSMGRE